MKKMQISDYDGFERKPEAEWTERDRMLLKQYGVIPLTDAGRKAYEAHLMQSPKLQEAFRRTDELVSKAEARMGRTEAPRQDSNGEIRSE